MSQAYQGQKRGNLVAANIELEILDTDSTAIPPLKRGRILLAGVPIFSTVVDGMPPDGLLGVAWDDKSKSIIKVPAKSSGPTVEWARHQLLMNFSEILQEALDVGI